MRPAGVSTRAAMAVAVLACCAWTYARLRRMRLTSLVFDHTDLGIVVTDKRGDIIAVNHAYCDITGYARSELIGRNPRIQQSGRHDEAFYRSLWHTLKTTGQWQGEIWNRRKSGVAYPVWQNISAVRDRHGCIVRFLAVVSDITPVKAVQERLDHLAHHDALTDLPNRLHFMTALERAVAHADRHGTKLALLFADLDHFKAINDSLGHAAGDQLLTAVAQRLRRSVRAQDLVARLAGDEFVIALESVHDREEAARVARKVLSDLEAPLELAGQILGPSASIGIALYPADARSATGLLEVADDAMYEAKRRGRHTFAFAQT
jgi:diguanylate cyclase (GGDEF)-like protein/PAS domain S-box-containing protein